mmetsp:Transcript_28223/g.48365  ORF Transcript_28223/g.48365 Transcript_28223/m.48365 type:complete len:368 (-) Transcript_28223:2-1105(-)
MVGEAVLGSIDQVGHEVVELVVRAEDLVHIVVKLRRVDRRVRDVVREADGDVERDLHVIHLRLDEGIRHRGGGSNELQIHVLHREGLIHALGIQCLRQESTRAEAIVVHQRTRGAGREDARVRIRHDGGFLPLEAVDHLLAPELRADGARRTAHHHELRESRSERTGGLLLLGPVQHTLGVGEAFLLHRNALLVVVRANDVTTKHITRAVQDLHNRVVSELVVHVRAVKNAHKRLRLGIRCAEVQLGGSLVPAGSTALEIENHLIGSSGNHLELERRRITVNAASLATRENQGSLIFRELRNGARLSGGNCAGRSILSVSGGVRVDVFLDAVDELGVHVSIQAALSESRLGENAREERQLEGTEHIL